MRFTFPNGTVIEERNFIVWGDVAEYILNSLALEYYQVHSITLRRGGPSQLVEGEDSPVPLADHQVVVLGEPPYYLHEEIADEVIDGAEFMVEVADRMRDEEGRVTDSDFVHRFSQWLIAIQDEAMLTRPPVMTFSFPPGGGPLGGVRPEVDLLSQILIGMGAPPPDENRMFLNALRDLLQAGMGPPQVGSDVKVVLSEEQIAQLRKQTYGSLEEKLLESCSVCLEDFQEADEVTILAGCPHYFHTQCIQGWLSHSSHKCPLCRAPSGEGVPLDEG